MGNGTRDSRRKVSSSPQGTGCFIWPLGKSPDTPDEMNTSYGPRIDADRWGLPRRHRSISPDRNAAIEEPKT